MSKMEIEVLCDYPNGSVVKMPGRAYPGLVVQGDTLVNLQHWAKLANERAKTEVNQELIRATGNLLGKINEMAERYHEGCQLAKAEK